MRRIFLVALLVAGLAAPGIGLAASSATLPIAGTPGSNGQLNGQITLGGVSGTITSSSNGTWTMTVGGVTFATGRFTCSGSACTYTGTVVGSTTTFHFSTGSLSAGALGFSTHGGWVSTVARWAGDHRSALAAAGFTVGDIVSNAAKIEGLQASGQTLFRPQGVGGHGSHGSR